MLKRYDCEQKCVHEVNANLDTGVRRQVLAAPTGAGKTAVAARIVPQRAMEGLRSLWLVYLPALLRQVVQHLEAPGLEGGIQQDAQSLGEEGPA